MRPFLLALAVLTAAPAFAQGPQYRARAGTFALTDCRIETVTRGVIERGTVVIEDGRITGVGDAAVPAGATQVACGGGTVYPGMIDAGTRLGLQEIGSQEETQDYDEVGDVTPQMKALTAINVSSVHIPITRVSGVTTTLSVPQGALMPGTAALVNLHGYTPEQMATGFEAVVLNFPMSGRRGRFDRREQEAIDKAAKEAVEKLDEVWEQAVLYARIDSARIAGTPDASMAYQPEFAALLPVVRGTMPLLVEANAATDIVKALEWLEDKDVRAILTGVAEGWRVADRIAEAGLPVIAGPVLGLPTRASDRYDRTYQNAALLAQAGVTVALRTDDGMQNYRNLPFHAGFAVAYGEELSFDRQAALEAITITPARIFGVDDDLGSVEVGKSATLFVADGDPFEPATQVTALFIDGYQIPLVSRQSELYEEYLQRVPGLRTVGEAE
ncbi:amidohydrolase family protein [Rubrivirga marina]|uniref:Amidohydrolase n=1 Tax=Rubrivirga marina TaxID=1196024 RepID=A0A271J4P0_9BACT|nr:amidohydrolase family protein [Rubrivirga marina]PAP78486.1 amidohydrolase [Rubrivirga marina]